MQITIPDDPRLRHRARTAGFASVQEYVLHLVNHEVQQVDIRELAADQQDAEEWIRDLRAFVKSIPPSNPDFDDSREAKYSVQ